MPVFRSEKASSFGRSIKKTLLNLKGLVSDARPGIRLRASEQRRIEKDISRLRDELRAVKGQKDSERLKGIKGKRREIFRLENELRAGEKQRVADEGMGALPDFVIIGAQKCGTTSLYHLLTRHPLVEPAASKELHFFDSLYDEGIEWYRECFPLPKWKDGRTTITGEATPGYLFHPLAPERMAKMVPEARLIALLRNPVDRAYSQYHQRVRKGRETRSFEEAVGAENPDTEYLARGIYVDQLLRWSRFYDRDQMLVLKSEEFFERPLDILKLVLNFLDLPEWQPDVWEIRKKGGYEEGIDPSVRRRLEEYFEPHNQRLYEYLGVEFRW